MAQNPRVTRHDSHSTTDQVHGWSTKRISITALFCALSAIATLFMEFPILPGVSWLKYDPSGIVALVAGFSFGPTTGVVVSTMPYLVHLTSSGVYGVVMAMLATVSLVVPAALIYKRNTTLKGAVIGMVVGGIICIAACIAGNLVITPLFSPKMTLDDVIGLILPALLPFNVIKIVLNCVLTGLIYKPVSKAFGN